MQRLHGAEHPLRSARDLADFVQMLFGGLPIAVEPDEERASGGVRGRLHQITPVDRGLDVPHLRHARRLSALRRSGSHSSRTRASRRAGRAGSPAFSSISRTSALPTTTPSATPPTAATWAGDEMPKPTATGKSSRL